MPQPAPESTANNPAEGYHLSALDTRLDAEAEKPLFPDPADNPEPKPAPKPPTAAGGAKELALEAPAAPEWLVDLAVGEGVPEEEAKKASPAELERLIRTLRHMGRSQPPHNPTPSPGAVAPAAPSSTAAVGTAPASGSGPTQPESDELGFLTEENGYVDPKFNDYLRRLNSELKNLRGKVAMFEQIEVARQTQTQAQQIDAMFGRLGESFEGVFGKGSVEEIAGTPQYYLRESVLRKFDADLQEMAASGKRIPRGAALQSMFEKCVRQMFPQLAGSTPAKQPSTPPGQTPLPEEEEELAARREEWKRNKLAQAETPPAKLSREERAVRAIAGAAASRGGVSVNGRASQDDFLD